MQGGGEHVVGEVGHLAGELGDAVEAFAAVEDGGQPGAFFVGLQLGGKLLVCGVGVDHPDQVVGGDLQLGVGQRLGVADQVGLGGGNRLLVEVG